MPPGKRVVGLCWLCKVKRKLDGSDDKYKGQVLVHVFSQVRGIHYNEVFAPTARVAAVCTIIAITAIEDLELESVDVSTVFLIDEIDADIYTKILEGLEVDGAERIRGIQRGIENLGIGASFRADGYRFQTSRPRPLRIHIPTR